MSENSIRGKRVIVTGSAGVIGTELVKILIERGANILSIDRYPLKEINPVGITHLQKDLATDNLDELLDFRPQIIFHLAAAFERSKESPEFWSINWQGNVLLSHRIIDFAKKIPDLDVFVFASSYLIYSPSLYLSKSLQDQAVLLKEEDLKEPRNVTGAAKYYTEKELEFIKEYYNPLLRIVYPRIFRVYGCGSRDVISRWIRLALSGDIIEVYNKENRFDYIFAQDVAEGLLRLAENPYVEGAVNLGSGNARSIEEVLNILGQYLPIRTKIRNLGTKESFEASCADLTKLKQLSGWCPTIDIEKGMETIIEFEQNSKKFEGKIWKNL